MSLGGGAYFEERNAKEGVPYDAASLPDMSAVFGPRPKPTPFGTGSLEKLKMRFRKMSLKWHPDKNIRRPEAAAEVFKAVNAAYHTLTTNNFDYKRRASPSARRGPIRRPIRADEWSESFTIPPMQSLEDVLVEMLLKKRGDYRPHQDFGVNLSIPWNAGSREDQFISSASGGLEDQGTGRWGGFLFTAGGVSRRGLEDRGKAELGYDGSASGDAYGGQIVRHVETQDLLDQFGAKAQVGADRDARPWETAYAKPKGRPDLTSQSEGAREAAEGFNDQAVKAFKAKDWQRCYDLSSEAIRLNPRKDAYLGNRAAAALKIKSYKEGLKDAQLTWEADWA
ncbi:hypothetical protein EMIHUDRAFT_244160 [Emiliania huxleyi CCMP1516]|uniref:J domain-containing protein n=2 Tax=Emiliania huxleyi TaxID=2903 RepID=A0A0D3J1B5_EMIH1|nr:hypothetical protein EMIHUDRAFT_244160 [Emiliania huxleyi CCMP1516]EOD17300.1 hypothetical protein EMIHUDRAFT_244160 [Emiliania huxleyi CCMP1516]|eukprot:XP_005769729.1 hypothetical protein EMIHUDRAFT_244160 [Emiliania huxleyi CCMP1516]